MTVEELRDCYKFEVERKDKLSASLTLPVGVLTVVGGLLGFLSKEFSYQSADLMRVFVVLLGAGVLTFAVSAVLLILAYYRYTYDYIPTPREFRVHEEKVRDSFRGVSGTTEERIEAQTKQHVENMRKRLYENAIEVNTKNNDTKAGYMHNSISFLIASLAFTMVATIPYAIDSRTKKKEIPEIRVTNLGELIHKNQMEVVQNGHHGTERRTGQTNGTRGTRANSDTPRPAAGPTESPD
jgi:hypothetical protein